MPFTLEAMRAKHGDSLLLHYGTPSEPRTILIDGGPALVYADALKPRLLQLRDAYRTLGALGNDGELVLELAMVSHIDDDHIRGLLDLTAELLDEKGLDRVPWLRPKSLWHNSFEALTADSGEALHLADDATVQSLSADGATPAGLRQSAAVVASVRQGARLRDEAQLLRWPLNAPFEELVRAPARKGAAVDVGSGVTLRVVAPRTDQIDALRAEWQEQMARIRAKEASPAEVAAYLDTSPYNLSSIVCLAEHGDKRVLLTGDARGDHILDALEAADVMRDGTLHVDILKLPHHGSLRNVDEDFFERITADHYIASGDGRHHNPESETLEMIAATRSDDDFALHLTYATGSGELEARVQAFVEQQGAAGRGFAVHCRERDKLSLRVDLLEPLER